MLIEIFVLFFPGDSVNFDRNKTVNPITGKVVDHWYGVSETYDSVFESLGSPYEECRAEGIAHYLCFEHKVMEIFGFVNATEIGNLLYATYFEMILAGIESLKMYNPHNQKWLQAHSQAGYVLLRVLLESEECRELIKIEVVEHSDKDGKFWLLMVEITRWFRMYNIHCICSLKSSSDFSKLNSTYSL